MTRISSAFLGTTNTRVRKEHDKKATCFRNCSEHTNTHNTPKTKIQHVWTFEHRPRRQPASRPHMICGQQNPKTHFLIIHDIKEPRWSPQGEQVPLDLHLIFISRAPQTPLVDTASRREAVTTLSVNPPRSVAGPTRSSRRGSVEARAVRCAHPAAAQIVTSAPNHRHKAKFCAMSAPRKAGPDLNPQFGQRRAIKRTDYRRKASDVTTRRCGRLKSCKPQ